VQYSVLREERVIYGDRSVQLCNVVCLGNSVLYMGIGLYSCVMECA
jgi:hypothetical protein